MRTFILLLCTTVFGFTSSDILSQNTKIHIDKDQEISIDAVFDLFRNQTDYTFIYPEDLFKDMPKVQLKKGTIRANKLLEECFSGNTFKFIVNGNKITILENEFMRKDSQSFEVSGKVSDLDGQPLPGASIVEKGTTNGVQTDFDGNFSLTVTDAYATLVISYIGFATTEITINGQSTFNISLEESSSGLDEVVVVGYGTQKKGNLTGSVSSVNAEDLNVAPIASTTNSLSGLLPGLVSKQNSGLPGSDQATLSIRGFGNALVIVDGVESSFNTIDANQIESISILKDGASSIYGARAGNGVILVTTKRGKNQKPTISLNSSMTYQGATYLLKPASSGQWAEMEREAWIQAGNPESTAQFTEEEIQKYYAGNDPLYPNTNWYKEVLRDWAPQQQHNVSVRGGSDKIKYYGFLGYTDQETMIKKNGGDYRRYNLQSNIDAEITNSLKLRLDMAATFDHSNFPVRGLSNDNNSFFWNDYWTTKPFYPAKLSDPNKIAWGGIDVGGVHVTSNTEIGGYDRKRNQNLRGTAQLTYNIRAVKGLSAKAFASYIQNNNFFKRFTKPVTFYTEPVPGTFTEVGSYNSSAQLSQGYILNNIFTQQYSLNYETNFFDDHNLTIMALYETIDYKGESLSAFRDKFLTDAIDQLYAGSTTGMSNNGSANEMGRKSYVGRLNYRYKNKYLLESILRADASAKFPSDKYWGYFPSASLGWVVSEEDFMNGFKNVDILKLRASYGQSGNDNVGDFKYLSGYVYGGTYIIGSGPQQGMISTGLANPHLTWERMSISNLGLDFSFLARKLYGEIDMFYRLREGIPGTRISSLPSTFGAALPPENINSLTDRGFEIKLGTSKKEGELLYDLSGNLSWSRAKWDHYDEPEYTDSDQIRINKKSGEWNDRVFGYLSDKLFTSQSEIDALPFDQDLKGNTTLKPGDIRYIDVNKDGKLDWKDQVEIGKSTIPHWMYGINSNFKYKNFDLSALFQGAFGYNVYAKLSDPSTLKYESRWTEENNDPNAIVPRLGGALTNDLYSDFFYKKASYLRLKSFSFGYNLPKSWLDKIEFTDMRIYMAGTNLLTFSKLNKYGIDPEAPNVGRYYPQQRTISLGLNLSF